MNPFEMVVLIVAIVMIASVLRARYGYHRRGGDDAIPAEERGNFVEAYYKRLTSDDEAVRKVAAQAWSVWEGTTSFLHKNQAYIDRCAGDV